MAQGAGAAGRRARAIAWDGGAVYLSVGATWRSGYAAVCKTVYPGSIPGVASNPGSLTIGGGLRGPRKSRSPTRSDSPMTAFYPRVLAALAKLAQNTQETRQALYERARTTLADRLRGLDPPLPPQRIMEERLAFEEAGRRAEADWQRALVEHELLSKLADALEHDPLPNDLPRRPGPSWTHLSGALEQSVTGSRFAYREDGRFGFAAGATEAERAAAGEPLARSIRAELDYKARELAGRLARIPDPARYRDLLDAVRMFTRALGAPEAGAAPDLTH